MTPPQDPLRTALTEILSAVDATPADVALETWVRFQSAILAGRAALRAASAEPQPAPDMPDSPETWDDADDMCPNCVTPWKCNGPHLSEQTVAARRHASRPAEPQPAVRELCPATQQTGGLGLFRCGLFAGHPRVTGRHYWFTEVTYPK